MARRKVEGIKVYKGELSGTLAQRLQNSINKGILQPT